MDKPLDLNVHLLMCFLSNKLKKVYNLIVWTLALVNLHWILKELIKTFRMQKHYWFYCSHLFFVLLMIIVLFLYVFVSSVKGGTVRGVDAQHIRLWNTKPASVPYHHSTSGLSEVSLFLLLVLVHVEWFGRSTVPLPQVPFCL